ncbi:MAG: hypothetical protein AAGA67_07730, partial [Cyanobacteria bacterium P01_F01_bin.153]
MTTGLTIKVGVDAAEVGRGLRGIERSAGGLGDRLNRSLSEFDIARAFKGAEGDARRAGRSAGEAYSRGFLADIRQGLGQGLGQALGNLPL